MDPVIITAAITGSITTVDANPHLPISVDQNIESILGAAEAGAAMVHIHAREEDGEPSQRLERFVPIVEGVREAGCDVILNLTTGSAAGRFSGAARFENLALRSEVCSFDCGSMNFGERVFENSLSFLRDLAEAAKEHGVKPEIECFDVGQVLTGLKLHADGYIDGPPLLFQFVLGVQGGAPATPETLLYMRSLVPPDAVWSICALGRHQLPLNIFALLLGGHVRTGLEDNIYYSRGVLAESNAQLVARVVRIANEVGRPIATPDQAREILGLKLAATAV